MTATAVQRKRSRPRRPEDDAPAGTIDAVSHTLVDGTIYAITFRRRVDGLPGSAEVEVYSQLRIPRLNRKAETTAAVTLPDGRRISARAELGSLNFKVATRILDHHLVPDLRRQSRDRRPRI